MCDGQGFDQMTQRNVVEFCVDRWHLQVSIQPNWIRACVGVQTVIPLRANFNKTMDTATKDSMIIGRNSPDEYLQRSNAKLLHSSNWGCQSSRPKQIGENSTYDCKYRRTSMNLSSFTERHRSEQLIGPNFNFIDTTISVARPLHSGAERWLVELITHV